MTEHNSALVTAAKPQKGGAFFAAPLGTALPADATTALDAAFVKLGYLSEDGFENPIETESSDVKGFGGDVVLTQQTGYKETFKTKLLQALDPDVLREVFGQENVTQLSRSVCATTRRSCLAACSFSRCCSRVG